VGEAGAYPNAAIVIGRWIPAMNRARAWGIVWMAAQVGAALSPLIVVPIQIRYGWHASFYVFGLVGVVWAIVWYAWFRDFPARKSGVSLSELEEIGAATPARHGGLPWRRALRSTRFWRLAAIAAAYVYALAFFQSWLQTYLVRSRGYTEAALVLSSLPYVVGACANGFGGFASDWLVRRYGLQNGRRTIGAVGLGFGAIFMAATMFTTSGIWALIFLTAAYAGILVQQPNLSALCLDSGNRNAGAVFGFMNMAGNAASSLSSIVFGYLVAATGSYDAPFVPMVALLCVGAWLWLTVEPERELFEAEADTATVTVTV